MFRWALVLFGWGGGGGGLAGNNIWYHVGGGLLMLLCVDCSHLVILWALQNFLSNNVTCVSLLLVSCSVYLAVYPKFIPGMGRLFRKNQSRD